MTRAREGAVGSAPRDSLARFAGSRAWCWLLCSLLACGGAGRGASDAADYDPNVARYRLLLRENPIDPGQAFRCYGSCQSHEKPDGYLGCLAQCPAFEVTEGVACAPDEVPPVAACITARKLEPDDERDPGYLVVAVLANVALVVALGVACASNTSCGAYYYYPYPAGQPPPVGPGGGY